MAQMLKKTFDVGHDVKITLYARRYMCYWLNRTPRLLLRWVERRIVPPPIFKVDEKSTWFTADEIYIYVRAAVSNDIRRGIALASSPFSVTVWGEVLDLRDRIQTQGPHILKKEVKQDELIRIIQLFDWRRKRTTEELLQGLGNDEHV